MRLSERRMQLQVGYCFCLIYSSFIIGIGSTSECSWEQRQEGQWPKHRRHLSYPLRFHQPCRVIDTQIAASHGSGPGREVRRLHSEYITSSPENNTAGRIDRYGRMQSRLKHLWHHSNPNLSAASGALVC